MGKGAGDSTQTENTNSSYNPAQSDNYKELLARADSWLANGGINMGTDYSGQMGDILSQNQQFYQSMMSGSYDKQALQNSMQANADAMQTNFDRNIMTSIGSSSQMAGGGAGSRRGIAEGLAASDMNAQIQQTNANMIWQAEQGAMQNKMAGAAGMSNLMNQYQQLGQYEAGRENSYLESLLAYQSMISGNMGYDQTTNSTGTVEGN